jgi:arylsulfatase A-like enzyme/Flp pilus assembly protein TadD
MPVLLAALMLGACTDSKKPNLVLLTLDTTRADHLGAYGHPQSQTPVIDLIAEKGWLFERAMATVPITLPSHASILTGRYPLGHGVRDNGVFKLGEGQLTLAEILKAEGYATGAAIGAYPLIGKFGMGQGFDYFNDRVAINFEDYKGERVKEREHLYFDERSAQQVNAALLPWVKEHADRPFFAWLHYFDPHRPWEAVAPFSNRFPNDGYLAEIAYSDHAFGLFLRELEAMGLLENTVIVIVGDHGEGLGQHQEQTHSLLNYNSTLHVPLIIKAPDIDPGRVDEIVSTVDVVPTVLELLNIPNRWNDKLDGRSLTALAKGEAQAHRVRRNYYAETLSPRISHGWGELRTLYYGDYKYIHGPRPEFYDLASDPQEHNDLIASDPERAEVMKERLSRWLNEYSVETASHIEADHETIQRLMSLGYISGNAELTDVVSEKLTSEGLPPQDRVLDNGLLSSAKNYIFTEQYGNALSVIAELRRRDADNWIYMDMQLRVLLSISEFDAARDLLVQERRKRRLRARHAQVLASLIATSANGIAKAIAVLLGSEADGPTAEGQYLLAKLYTRQGEEEMAAGALLAATRADGDFAPAAVSLAIRYAKAGREAKAEKMLLGILDKRPFHPRALYNLGTLNALRGEVVAAEALFERCLAVEPQYVKAREALALLQGGNDE